PPVPMGCTERLWSLSVGSAKADVGEPGYQVDGQVIHHFASHSTHHWGLPTWFRPLAFGSRSIRIDTTNVGLVPPAGSIVTNPRPLRCCLSWKVHKLFRAPAPSFDASRDHLKYLVKRASIACRSCAADKS